jgi:hypothetical protein
LRHYGGVVPRAAEFVDAALPLAVPEGVLA